MREKYESLAVSVLRDLAKARGIKGISGMKKEELVEAILHQDDLDASMNEKNAAPRRKPSPAKRENESRGEGVEQKGTEKAVNEKVTTEKGQDKSIASEKTNAEKTDSSKKEGVEKSDATENVLPENLLPANGILEIMSDGFGFIRCDNYMPGNDDVYVSSATLRKFGLKSGDIVVGMKKFNNPNDKFAALYSVTTINGYKPEDALKRKSFEKLTPIFPDERIKLERPNSSVAMRIVDLVSPIGKGQRGMIVSQPKAGKTTLLKEVAKSVTETHPDMQLIILLIDERPEEVTDIKEAIIGRNVEVNYSTFDETPEHHRRVSEMVIERAKRLVEHGKDVMILLDSITRLARAYNMTVPPSGRTLSGGLDPAALHMPKKFFGAARNMREGGSLTILATALVDTGSKMDDVVYEEFKGTGNMELILDRKLSEKRVFPAIDITGSGTRREDLLLNPKELEAVDIMRKAINGQKKDEAVESILNLFAHSATNDAVIDDVINKRIFSY